MLSEFDIRVNSPIKSERVSGELLYSQLRMRPLTPFPVSDLAFYEDNTAENTRSAWTSPLTEAEASVVAGYTSRGARWLDVMHVNPSLVASSVGMSQFRRLEALEGLLRSAVGKSLTYGMVLRHYIRKMPSPPPGEPPMRGRVYVLGSYTSCSLVPRSDPGYGSCEVRIVSTPGAGKGVFVSEPDACMEESEFLLMPGTTLRVVGCRRGVLMAEQVRPLSVQWNNRLPDVFPPAEMVKEDVGSTACNSGLICALMRAGTPNTFPDVAPAPVLNW